MPIEIRELHIKAVIDGSKGTSAGNQNGSSGQSAGQDVQGGGGDIDSIVNVCVEKILEILKDQRER